MRTTLRSSRSMQERQQSMLFDANLMKRLSHRFRHSRRVESLEASTAPAIPSKETEQTEEEEGQHGIGAIIHNDSRADVLRQKMDFEPLFKLRGVDIFLTDCADQEMGTHPFLMKYVVTISLNWKVSVYEKLTSLLVFRLETGMV